MNAYKSDPPSRISKRPPASSPRQASEPWNAARPMMIKLTVFLVYLSIWMVIAIVGLPMAVIASARDNQRSARQWQGAAHWARLADMPRRRTQVSSGSQERLEPSLSSGGSHSVS